MAAHRLGDGGVGAVAAVGAGLAESAEGGVYYPGVPFFEGGVAEAEAFHGAWAEVLDDYVAFLD